jgi:hypothetical protein
MEAGIGLDAPQREARYITGRALVIWLKCKRAAACFRRNTGAASHLSYGFKFGGIGGSSFISVMVTRRLAAM